MKIKTTAFIHVFYLILVSAVFVACSSGNKPEEKINKHDERINGAAITSEYEIRSDEECFELLSKSNHSFSYIPSSDNTVITLEVGKGTYAEPVEQENQLCYIV